VDGCRGGRYREIGIQLAQRIRSGELPPGSPLPTVRHYARQQRTTTSTVSRAYRYLLDAGVITSAERRRARAATDAVIAAARILQADRVFQLAGSDDSALQVLLTHVGPAVVSVGTRGSFHGLRALAAAAPTAPPSTYVTTAAPTTRRSPGPCCATVAPTFSTSGGANRAC
jgi:DNA-binding transcriptional MocR family regulator